MRGGSFMVWGAFSAQGRSDPIVLRDMQDLNKYYDTLEESLLAFIDNYSCEVRFKQDNAPIHTSN